MRYLTARRAMKCIVAVMLLAAPAGVGASDVSAWQNLAGLRAGQGIEVLKQNHEWVKGAFVTFGEDSVSVLVKKHETAIPRAEVRQVRLAGKGRKATWIGLGVGAGAGAALGARWGDQAAEESGGDFANLKPAFIGIAAGAGALTGLVVGSWIGGRGTMVYRVQSPPVDRDRAGRTPFQGESGPKPAGP